MPSTYAEFHKNTGMLLAARQESVSGNFCRQCGIAAFRSTTNHCLWAGWWGLIAFFTNFYAIARNLGSRSKISKLAEPTPPNPALKTSPLVLRPGLYVGVALIAVLGYFVGKEITTSDAEALDGDCVVLEDDFLREVSCSSTHDAKVIDVVEIDGDEFCPPETDDAFILEADETRALCLDFDR